MSRRIQLVRLAVALAAVTAVACVFAGSALALDQTPVSRMLKVSSGCTGYIAGDGAVVSWNENDGGVWSIQAIDVQAASSKEVTITTEGLGPVVSGRTIFWSSVNGIYQTNFDTLVTKLLVPRDPDQEQPRDLAVSGDVLVWGSTFGPVEGMHISSGKRFMINDNGQSYQPDIAGDWVVYTDNKVGPNWSVNGDIMAYQVSTGRTYTLCSNPSRQYEPHIGETGVVAWQDERNSVNATNMDIYGSSVWSRKEFPINTSLGNQGGPQVMGTVVAYADGTKPGGYTVVGRDTVSGLTFGLFAPALTSPSSSWSEVGEGGIAWTKNRFINDGTEDGRTEADLYIAYPAQLGQVGGADCYSLAAAASRLAYPTGAAHAVIASGQNWSDAISGAGLVGTDSAFLLTQKDLLPAATATELRRLKATSVDILGGTGSISAGVQSAIQAILAENAGAAPAAATAAVASVNRIQGVDRYAVAASIARRVASRPGFGGTVLIASGTGFPDAVSSSPLAAHAGLPVLLSGAGGLTAGEMSALRASGAKRVVVVGGPASVPAAAIAQAASVVGSANVTRVWGANRYSTAYAVAKYGTAKLGLKWQGAGIASGNVFAETIVGGVLKGKQGSVMLLTDGSALSYDTGNALRAKRISVRSADYIGGTSTISRTVRTQVRAILR